MDIANLNEILLVAAAIATSTNRVTEIVRRLFAAPINRIPDNQRVGAIMLISAVVAIVTAYMGCFDVIQMSGVVLEYQPAFGYILSGVVCSGGANSIHAVVKFLSDFRDSKRLNGNGGKPQ